MKVFDGGTKVKGEVPEHLEGLREEIGKVIFSEVDDGEYAEIAFKLVEASQGDKDAIKDVAEYIKKQHRALKGAEERMAQFVNAVSSWLYWAKNWTVRKLSV